MTTKRCNEEAPLTLYEWATTSYADDDVWVPLHTRWNSGQHGPMQWIQCLAAHSMWKIRLIGGYSWQIHMQCVCGHGRGASEQRLSDAGPPRACAEARCRRIVRKWCNHISISYDWFEFLHFMSNLWRFSTEPLRCTVCLLKCARTPSQIDEKIFSIN